ncbi:WXG100 family type VII secretion target [Rhodococcus sp. 077-4]|uniref:WXG100 family type VII secretion target n=1 Tax=Rhodococcus sp. 077-4 TaxID=2789271 RepID=UPI0039F47AF8
MTPTVPHVAGWEPESMRKTMIELSEIVERVNGQRTGVLEEQDALAETWTGDAADAAAERVVTECSRMGKVCGEIESLGKAFDTAAGVVEAAQTHLQAQVSAATTSGFAVSDDGLVNPDGMIALIPDALGHEKVRQAGELRAAAAQLTLDIQGALRQAEHAAADAAHQLAEPTKILTELALSSPTGKFVENPDGSFSWMPDWPTTAAATVIGGMSDATKRALELPGVSSVDDVAKNIGRGLGAFGAVAGTIPSIAHDIDEGVSPTEAILVNSASTAIGLAAASYATYALAGLGGVAGSVFPGPGTVAGGAAGVALGTLVGGTVSHTVSKMFEWTLR